ncbi:MAG TPA: hypothetical protein VGM64_15315 [Lacunisphaera sp.]|jgi:hypothetical protein
MRALRLLLTAFLALFAVFVAIAVFLGRLLGRSVRKSRPVRPLKRKREAGTPSDEVIEVETTVVSAEQGER